MFFYTFKRVLFSTIILCCVSFTYSQNAFSVAHTGLESLASTNSFIHENNSLGKNILANNYSLASAQRTFLNFSENTASLSSAFSAQSDDNEHKNILGMYIQAGYGKLRFNFNDEKQYSFDYVPTKGGGISLEIPLKVMEGRFSVYNELGFSIFKAHTAFRLQDTASGDPVNNYFDYTITYAPNIISLSNIARYSLTPNEFQFYVAVGISNSFVISPTNIKESIHTLNGEVKTTTEDAVPSPAVHGLSILTATGFSYRNIGLEIRFDPGRNYSNKLNYAVYMPTFYALLHVRFNPGRM
jgi:hypothetical protein